MKAGYELFFGSSESDTMALTVLEEQTIDDYYMEQVSLYSLLSISFTEFFIDTRKANK